MVRLKQTARWYPYVKPDKIARTTKCAWCRDTQIYLYRAQRRFASFVRSLRTLTLICAFAWTFYCHSVGSQDVHHKAIPRGKLPHPTSKTRNGWGARCSTSLSFDRSQQFLYDEALARQTSILIQINATLSYTFFAKTDYFRATSTLATQGAQPVLFERWEIGSNPISARSVRARSLRCAIAAHI